MDKQKIFAIITKEGREIHRAEVGVAVFQNGTISPRKYDELKKAAFKAFPNIKKGQKLLMVTEDGRTDMFGGYPAFANVRFTNLCEKVKELRTVAKMTQQQFSDFTEVPLRTIQHWEAGDREVSKYLLHLIEYKLKNEGMID